MDDADRTASEMATAAVLAPSQPAKPKYSEKRKQQNRAAQKIYRMFNLKRAERYAEPTPQERSASSV